MPPLAFDTVRVTEGDNVRSYSVTEFLDLPIHQRVQYVLSRKIQFLSGSNQVRRGDALQNLRSWELERRAS